MPDSLCAGHSSFCFLHPHGGTERASRRPNNAYSRTAIHTPPASHSPPPDYLFLSEKYTHLFLWNKEKHEVVGAYRLGDVNSIIQRYGENGLYTSTLFHYRSAFLQQINNALELGRAFVRPEYQRHYSSLFLLWKGIGHFVARNPRHKTLFDPVTISNSYKNLSRQLMVSYLKTNNYSPDMAKFVRPRLPIRLTSLKEKKPRSSRRL